MNHHYPNGLTEQDMIGRIRKADENFEIQLVRLSDALNRASGLRFFGLTGPTCSGKTTAARMLTERLEALGHNVHVISIDDFYFEKNYLRMISEQKGSSELDYDSEDTIDVSLLHDCAESLAAGRPTRLPHFNFLSGLRENGAKIIPTEGDLFLFEGIQILYPRVHAILNEGDYQSIAICPLSGITVGGHTFEPNEIRLMRRLVRDELYRAASASFTLSLWKGVRENEEKNIFPNFGTCSHIVDSTMPYEIGILKPYLEKCLCRVPADDPNFARAQSILEAIRNVEPIRSDLIADKSLYREFI
ncbi:MAG: hypothetical protein J5885_02920 [Clostridia bacterium]|nr:hypothetical protein [Clostridia bacterium]